MSKQEKERTKQIQDKCQSLLSQMLRDEDNKYCVDCDAKGPRWASWNIGVFLCIRCAGIHRNLGVHISKVKSVNLDSWTPSQVVCLQQMGNSRGRAVYEANLPDSFRRPQTDSALESFIRAKYETKKYIASEWTPQPIPVVNWDKELDEEAERLKKKKREGKIGSSSAAVNLPAPKKTVEIPQPIPKPTSSPKSHRGTPPRRGVVDLLGIDTSAPTPAPAPTSSDLDDEFSSFLSAPQPQPQPPASTLSEEENSFFNQTVDTGAEKPAPGGKLTKDSILALYGAGPIFPTGQSQTRFGCPTMVYQAPTPFGGATAFPMTTPRLPTWGIPEVSQESVNPFYSMDSSANQPGSQVQNHTKPNNWQNAFQ